MDFERLRKAIEVQKELIVTELIAKSESGVKLTDEEFDMLESFYESNVQEEE